MNCRIGMLVALLNGGGSPKMAFTKRKPAKDQGFRLPRSLNEKELMINLMTTRRRIATLFAVTATLIGSTTEAQDVNLTMTDTPLLLNNVPASVVEEQIYYGPELPPELQPVPPAAVQEDLPATMIYGDETLPEMPAEVDVLTRGPLHEAFATAHQSNPESSPFVAQAPPELIDEVPPEYKPEGNNVQWIPGYWAWDDAQEGFIWISGVWRDVPPQRRWVPGYWDQTNSGHRWISGFWAEETQQEMGYLPAPPETIDQGPSTAAPSEEHFYVPGNWQYQDERYRWLSGHWQPRVENWIWIPAQYVWTPSGCIYRSGYWDYEFDQRGTCFAPVHFKRPVYLATNYSYRPSFAINLNIDFLTHLFVRPRYGHYYYGDFYSSNFVNFGYRPWVSYRSHYRSYDPLLTYYRSRRSGFDRRFNTVQYLAQQHRFYANNISYRPRPTFVAQFNFSNNIRKHQNRHPDFLRKSSYVRTYSNIRKTAQSNSQRRSRELQLTSNRLERERQRQRVQYRRIKDDELRSNRQKIDQLAKLQRDRKKNEIRLTSNNINVRTSTNRHRTLKLPANLSTNQARKVRNEFPNSQRASNGKQFRSENNRSDELRKAVTAARKKAAAQERSQRQRDQSNQIANRNQRNDRERQRQQLNQLANQRSQTQASRNSSQLQRERDRQRRTADQQRQRTSDKLAADRSRQQREQQNRLQQQKRQSENQARERTRQLQQQQRAQETARKARERQNNEQARRSQAERQQRANQQQRRDQDQARRAQDQARKAQADRDRQARQRQAQQDSARRAQQKTQRDAAKRAQQQRSQRDSARKAQQQRQRDAARRTQQQRNRTKPTKAKRPSQNRDKKKR